jgi:hypothetical protein
MHVNIQTISQFGLHITSHKAAKGKKVEVRKYVQKK